MEGIFMDVELIKTGLASRQMERIYPRKNRNSAVMIPLIETEDGVHILFEVRASTVRQGGEICFPGGRIEGEEKPIETAIRETEEELLLEEEQIEVLAPMHVVMMGPGGAEIQSYLGRLHGYKGSFSGDEVERVFTVPLEWFAQNKPLVVDGCMAPELPEDFPFALIKGGKDYRWSKVPKHYYFWQYNEKGLFGLNEGDNDAKNCGGTQNTVIWGITGEVLYHCLRVLGIYK